MKFIFTVLFFAISLIPFYFFSSGKPQISHLLLLLVFIIIIFKESKILNILKIFKGYTYLFYFILWSIIIGFLFFILHHDKKTIIAPSYFIFNFLLVYSITRIYLIDKIKLQKIIFNSLFLSVVVLLFIDFFNLENYFHSGEDLYRKILTFNNPNQLGYWSLLVTTIIYIIKPNLKKGILTNLKFYFLIVSLLYLSMISLSKASTISILILIFFNSIKNIKAIIIIPTILLIIYSVININEESFLSRFEHRMEDVGDAKDDNLEGRGYYRIINYPEYLLFGAGEGATEERFNTEIELHSSFGTILFSYGFIGAILFFLFLYKTFTLSKIKFLQLLSPILLYGIAHMGLRFSLFWLSITLFILIVKDDNLNAKKIKYTYKKQK